MSLDDSLGRLVAESGPRSMISTRLEICVRMSSLGGKPSASTIVVRAADTARKKSNMGVTNYINLGEAIVGERSLGGSRVNYANDALGSVTGTLIDRALENTYSYKAYGDVLQETGGGTRPLFLWLGSMGYQRTQRRWIEYYVRARHYTPALGKWSTRDPLWPSEAPYSYAGGNPGLNVDPSGLGQTNSGKELKWLGGLPPDGICPGGTHYIGGCTRYANHDVLAGSTCRTAGFSITPTSSGLYAGALTICNTFCDRLKNKRRKWFEAGNCSACSLKGGFISGCHDSADSNKVGTLQVTHFFDVDSSHQAMCQCECPDSKDYGLYNNCNCCQEGVTTYVNPGGAGAGP